MEEGRKLRQVMVVADTVKNPKAASVAASPDLTARRGQLKTPWPTCISLIQF